MTNIFHAIMEILWWNADCLVIGWLKRQYLLSRDDHFWRYPIRKNIEILYNNEPNIIFEIQTRIKSRERYNESSSFSNDLMIRQRCCALQGRGKTPPLSAPPYRERSAPENKILATCT